MASNDHRVSAFARAKHRPSPLGLSQIRIGGELLKRASRNFDRLEEANYHPANVFQEAGYSWPGDMEGRTILALTLLAQATGREPQHLNAILDGLGQHCNARGYMGRILELGLFDEQQLSGHSWLLRGLCEHYLWTGSTADLERIETITNNLLLPLRGGYAAYPARPEDRKQSGEAIGSLDTDPSGNWYSSTDIGCAFITLDGATQVYQITRNPQLGELIEEMIAAYLSLDFVGLSCQTHATLSGLRGLLRYCEQTKSQELLSEAERIWALYQNEGMTENHANYNWFGRPHWTEPCAIVDSLLVAMILWRLTGDPQRITEAHDIYYSALGHAQRPNGGFGCDTCVGSDELVLSSASDGLFEAWWCCTMRGAEGLARAVESLAYVCDDSILLPFYCDAEFDLLRADGKTTLAVATDYPYSGRVTVTVRSAPGNGCQRLGLFLPGWVNGDTVRLTVKDEAQPIEVIDGFVHADLPLEKDMRLELQFDIGLRTVGMQNRHSREDCFTLRHGPLVLGASTTGKTHVLAPDTAFEPSGNRGSYTNAQQDLSLKPVNDMLDLPDNIARSIRRQVCFSDPTATKAT